MLGDVFRLRMPGRQLSPERGAMLTKMNKPLLMKEQQLHGPFLDLTTSTIWRQTGIRIDGWLCDLLQNIYAQGRGLTNRHVCVGVASEMMTICFAGNRLSERKEGADKQWLLPFVVLCLFWLYRSRPVQLQEAFIMSLAKGGKSQYSKNKNGSETWGAFE